MKHKKLYNKTHRTEITAKRKVHINKPMIKDHVEGRCISRGDYEIELAHSMKRHRRLFQL